jgi:hypothetical protein
MNNMKKTFIETNTTSVVATSVYQVTQYPQLSTSRMAHDSAQGICDPVFGIKA